MPKKKTRRWTESRMERCLVNLLTRVLEKQGGDAATFDRKGVLSMQKGVVIDMPDGSQFQLTIVDSTRRPSS